MNTTLVLDIETSPLITYVWQQGLYNVSIHKEQVIKDTHLLSVSYKWFGEKQVFYIDQSKQKDLSNDKSLCLKLREAMEGAEVIVAHNGRAFDVPYIKARMVINGIPPPSPFRVIDTYTLAKKEFGFTYNSLEYLADALNCKHRKLPHKKFAGIELWRQCLLRNKSAWEEMKKYNINDVLALEDVYVKLRSWTIGHPNMAIYIDDDKPRCPKCGGSVIKRGYSMTNFGIFHRYQCQKPPCFGWSRGRKSTVKLKNQLVN
jgi:DNA polymerase III alpha subunit (gram-positive type)